MKIPSAAVLAILILSVSACGQKAKSGFVTVNGVRLQYLDWRGSSPALIFIHGLGDNPHIFDDLAPAFTDHFRVVAYARRGHGQSDVKGPYDTATLTEDLRGLMDGLGISKANLAGWSMGGDEITAMAGTHPERVDRTVYLDAAYDWADPAFVAAFKAIPPIYMEPQPSAARSLDAFRAYLRMLWFPSVSDPSRFDAYIRDLVVVQPDGTVRPRMSDSAAQALATTLPRTIGTTPRSGHRPSRSMQRQCQRYATGTRSNGWRTSLGNRNIWSHSELHPWNASAGNWATSRS